MLIVHSNNLSVFLQDGLPEETSSMADDVFETSSEANLKQQDESALTGSSLERNNLERNHLTLWVSEYK